MHLAYPLFFQLASQALAGHVFCDHLEELFVLDRLEEANDVGVVQLFEDLQLALNIGFRDGSCRNQITRNELDSALLASVSRNRIPNFNLVSVFFG